MNRASLLGWSYVALASLLYVYDFILRVAPNGLAMPMMAWLDLQPLGWSWVQSMFYIGYALMQVPAGLLMDHYGAKKPLILGSLLGGCCALVPVFCKQVLILALARLLMGMAASFAYLGPLMIARHYLPLQAFALAGGAIQVLGCLGAVLSTWPLEHADAHSLSRLWLMLGILGMLCAGAFWLFLPKDAENPHQETSFKSESWKHVRWLLGFQPIYRLGYIAYALWAPILLLLETWGGYWMQQMHLPASVLAGNLTLGWLAIALGGVIWGAWMQSRPHLGPKLLKSALCGSMLGLGLLFWMPSSAWIWALALSLIGAMGAAQCLTFGLLARVCPEDRLGVAIGMNNMAIVSSGLTLLPAMGHWLEHYPSAQHPQILHHMLFVPGALLLLALGWLARQERADAA